MSADRLADIKAREQAAFGGPWHVLDADENGMHAVAVDGTVLVEVGDFCDAEFIAASRDDIPHLLALVESLTAERDAFRKREEHLVNEVERWRERFPCDGLCSDAPEEDCSRHGRSPADLWRIISEIAAERDALVTTVGRVQALVDSNPDHADTCGSVLTPGAGYPCSCWQADLRAALATTGEDQ